MRTRRDKRIKNEIAALAALPDADIDTSDIPEVKDWDAATQGRFHRRNNKQVIVRLHDRDSERLRASLAAWKEHVSREARASLRRLLDDFPDLWPQLLLEPDPERAMSRAMSYAPMEDTGPTQESPAKTKMVSHPFDRDYIRRLKARDPATEAHFVAYFSRGWEMKLRNRGLAASTIEDVIQESFYRVLTTMRGGAVLFAEKFAAYVNSVCDNVVRERGRAFASSHHLILEAKEFAGDMDNPEATLLRKEQMAIVAEILNQFPAKEQNLLRALIYEQLSANEMCERFGVKPDYLRVILWRARAEFVARARILIGEKGPSAALGGAKGRGIAGTLNRAPRPRR